MKIERIAFRFRKDELQILMKLLGIQDFPGMPAEPVEDEKGALQSLIDDGIVQPTGEETMMVDRAVSLVLLNAAAYERCGIIDSGRTYMALFKGKLFYVILCIDGNVSSLCPIKEREQACQQFLQEAMRIQPVRIAVMEKGAELNWDEAPKDDQAEFVEQRLLPYIGGVD